MKPLIQLKAKTPLFFITLVIACTQHLPWARAVVPPPDGGYPNFNTAEGQNALFSLTSGTANTALGWFSLKSVTAGSFNTGVGAGTLVLNTGEANTATGTAALLLNTTGQRNTANGTAALVNNSAGEDNTAVGAFALNNNTVTGNTAIGSSALLNNTTGGTLTNGGGLDVGPNVAVGWQALQSNVTTGANTAVGYQALHSFTGNPSFPDVGASTAVGFQALANTTENGLNSGFGYQALFNNTTGSANTASGGRALHSNTTGSNNVANGFDALHNNVTGSHNTAMGAGALGNGTGSDNTGIGYLALTHATGTNNTSLGANAGSAVMTASNVICIGANVAGENSNGSCYIGSIFGNGLSSGSSVYINANGKLGTSISSRRFKEKIKPMEKASEALFGLKPVTFHYKKEIDPAGTSQFGLVAEEVDKVNSDLVVRDKEAKPYSVRYDQVNAMLLNEFLKEHKKVEKQQATIAELKSTVAQQQKSFESKLAKQKEQIEALAAGLQKVSAQLEMSKPARQPVLSAR